MSEEELAALAVDRCVHCHLGVEPAAELPNGSAWRHVVTGWRRCRSDRDSTWAEVQEELI